MSWLLLLLMKVPEEPSLSGHPCLISSGRLQTSPSSLVASDALNAVLLQYVADERGESSVYVPWLEEALPVYVTGDLDLDGVLRCSVVVVVAHKL